MKTYIEIIALNIRMLYSILKWRKQNLILLFGSPYHTNMGDQAQTYCIVQWLKRYYPEYEQLIFTYVVTNKFFLWLLKRYLKPQDKIFFHSGYHLTDRFNECSVYCKVIKLFPTHSIVIFPQTINFLQNKNAEEVANVFNSHEHITLMCRDEVSLEKAKKLFSCCHLLLYPDIVTSLIGKYPVNKIRSGVLFCIRNDVESFYTNQQIDGLIENISAIELCTKTDTTVSLPYRKVVKDRKKILEQIFLNYSKYKLTITDRYHGVIFSLIAGTPVIVLSSADHKLSSGIKWFPVSFSKYVLYAHSLEEAHSMAESLLLNKEYMYNLEPYFEKEYYSLLKSLLDDKTM